MNRSPALDTTSLPAVSTCGLPAPDFHALGLAGSIDRLTSPLRGRGTAIEWQTPHHGVEIDASAAAMLYHAAADILAAVPMAAANVTIRLAAVYHGIRLTVVDNGAACGQRSALAEHIRMTVEPAGGALVLESGDAGLTRVAVTLPLD
ncbi:histidine kinase [Arthrobacter crystallopoietes BAB-32]|uniref:Histidine kinase n=1 Tax=Arthrobacter crystallopoietes BAB-32 TaxID=1246476 RepID=N1V2V2_9MICC|nr:hypothetical protein [Arthrobacter crystallopoietes]EMY34304.1 histidine kinase [Arthrobacter crystallopoietes BAB-32]